MSSSNLQYQNFFQNICFRDVNLKNYLIVCVKQNKPEAES